jgi:16S rRNA (guanine(527)-N(7))-methyltransferase RsmG
MVRDLSYRTALSELELTEDEQLRLAVYLDLLSLWNRRVNLTGRLSRRACVETLVSRVLPARPFIAQGQMIDIGSGNGSPGIVLAIVCRPDHVTLIEPRSRRWAFLREAIRTLGIANADVLRVRYQDYDGTAADTVTVRGLKIESQAIAPLVTRHGRVVIFGGRHETGSGFREVATVKDVHIWERST